MRGPMFELREGCDPKRYRDAPILHFGFGINEEQIYRVAAASSLLPVKRHLEKVANARLHFRIPVSYEFELMFALYSNYSIEDEQYEDEHEQEVLRIIQSELGIEQQPPLWYWDRSNNG
ncbi:hypothetical protein BV25DRAFT_1823885 [Artomyces pyxidatus]|uniref:Uncharacterized protein n=1 Tax=Artomyces pyxidatus TaxID=48021 RepID=A0ACB8T5P9_9AGAM|nr:hypothetical protein BV25DRAFT_1823885 [Artomyces pyxidatus]